MTAVVNDNHIQAISLIATLFNVIYPINIMMLPNMKYYSEGFNLYKRMKKYRDNLLLFLHVRNVDPINNLSERLLHVTKRK